MYTIDLKAIIQNAGLDLDEVAAHLFPKNNYPKLALNRILSGKAVLDANQISRLSMLTSVPIAEFFGGPDTKFKLDPERRYTVESENFKAELDTRNWVVKLYAKDSLFHAEVLESSELTLGQYIDKLNLLITKYKENEQSKN